ncbi:MAG: HAD family hydrolase [Gemmatimonadota bacterium]
MTRRPSAVLLDVDGTLLLSNAAHARAFVLAAERMGIEDVELEEIRRMIGMGGDKLIPMAFGFEAGSDRGEELDTLKGEIFRSEFVPHLEPAPGARPLLERFRADGLRRVVATSANEEDLSMLLDRAGIADLIEDATSASDVDRSKPDPDIVTAALKLTGEAPDRVAMLGDTPYDVEASLRAGVRIVGVRCGGWQDEDLRGASAVFDDPADLLTQYDSSLFA